MEIIFFLQKLFLRDTFFLFRVKIASFWKLQDFKIRLPNSLGVKVLTYKVAKQAS